MESSTISPWEMLLMFLQLWDVQKIAWIAITILLVFVLHWFATRVRRKTQASWIQFLFWLIAIIGWWFGMYMVIWEMINTNPFISISLLVIATFAIFIAFIIFFSIVDDEENKKHVTRIVSGTILAFIAFGMIAFMGMNKFEFGLSILMGGLLGGFLSLLYFNFKNMSGYNNSEHSNSNDDWKTPPV